MTSKIKRILFINLASNTIRSRSGTYFEALKTLNYDVKWFDITTSNKFSDLLKLAKNHNRKECEIVVTCKSQILVPLAFLIFRKRPVLDAGWPLYDGTVTSRSEYGFLGATFLKTVLIDVLAINFSRVSLWESSSQCKFARRFSFQRTFGGFTLLTGFTEKRVEPFKPPSNLSRSDFRILFRGGNQPESNLESLVPVAKKLAYIESGVSFVIISQTCGEMFEGCPNVTVIPSQLTDNELFSIMSHSDLLLGQLSRHPRLKRTIPHKFFEAAYLGKPYLTSNFGVMDTFGIRNLVLTFSPSEKDGLLNEILRAKDLERDLVLFGGRLKNWYIENASSEVLAKQFLRIISGDLT